MPRKKKQFIDRKTATDFRLLVRSQQDKFADDPSAPQHVLQDVSRKKQQQKFGIYFQDDYDYMQHLRPRVDVPEDEVSEEDIDEALSTSEMDNQEAAVQPGAGPSFDLNLPEELLGFDDVMFEGRVIEREEELDADLLEAMQRAEEEPGVRVSDMEDEDEDEEGEDEGEGSELEDDFVCLAAGAGDQEQEAGPTGPLLDHFFDTLGGVPGLKLAMYGEGDEEDEVHDPAEQLRAERRRAEAEGRAPEDYHSQCLQLQIEKIVEAAVTYDIDEVRSHLSGVSVPLSESMRQALATDERHRQQSIVYNPEETMSEAERNEHISRTLAMISEEEKSDDEEDVDPVQAWVDFDRRCKISSNVDAPRGGYVPITSALGSTVRLPGSRRTSQSQESPEPMEQPASVETEEVPRGCPERKKNETVEEKRARKAACKSFQRERRIVKKQNRVAFKTESARQSSTKKPEVLVRM